MGAKSLAVQTYDGVYAFGAAGVDFRERLYGAQKRAEADMAVGGAGRTGAGWRFGNGLRAEIEGDYRSTSIKSISTRRQDGILEPLQALTGNLGTTAVMANVKYDVPTPSFGLPLRPYIGGGLGYANIRFGNTAGYELGIFNLPNRVVFIGPALDSFGSANAFAYQGLAGVAMPIGAIPGLEATLEYAYFGTARADVRQHGVTTDKITINGATPSGENHIGFLLHDQSVMLGLRYYFGAAMTSATN